MAVGDKTNDRVVRLVVQVQRERDDGEPEWVPRLSADNSEPGKQQVLEEAREAAILVAPAPVRIIKESITTATEVLWEGTATVTESGAVV